MIFSDGAAPPLPVLGAGLVAGLATRFWAAARVAAALGPTIPDFAPLREVRLWTLGLALMIYMSFISLVGKHCRKIFNA
jgi:hypothetical protein